MCWGLTAFLVEKNDQDERLPIIPLLPDNQGNICSPLDSKSRKMLSAAILMELMLLLHRNRCTGCTLAPSHVKRDINQWADELTHPDCHAFAPDRRLCVSRLLRGREFPHWLITMRNFSRQAHQCHTVIGWDFTEAPEALGAFDPTRSGDPLGSLARAARLDEEFQNRQLTKYAQEIMVHRKRNEWEEAIGIVQKIRDDGIRPTIKIMNTALSSLQYPGKWELVLDMMEQMRAEGYELDVCTHTVAVTSMITAGELEKASEHLQVMKNEGVEPTAMTYGRLMYGLEKADLPEKALYLWDEMRVEGIDPDRVGFETAVRACSKCQFDEAVLELYDEMKVRDKNPSRETARSATLAAERLGLSATVIEGATPITPEEPEDVEVLDALGR
ncbi:unnamed protein product [Symbiodinium necroappetens]|uniref:Pentatricopeptide repeat-containing protein-mitochondrial domain-containing protein n=1 Tax=Symbiodinium necroappetens TaxID=1628268 RepID=A0A813CDI7_9DINO|nr:unnamed protein product [Symbiodinium necroappetens]